MKISPLRCRRIFMIPLIFLSFQLFKNVRVKAEQVEIDTGFNLPTTVPAASANIAS